MIICCLFIRSPGTPESPESVFQGHLPVGNDESRFYRSKSTGGFHSHVQNGSKIPRPDSIRTTSTASSTTKSESDSCSRSDSETNLQKKILQKQMGTIGGVGSSSQDDDSLSGTESLDSEGRKKDKKKLKLIPKFMRKTET